jgi:hypothetical protein
MLPLALFLSTGVLGGPCVSPDGSRAWHESVSREDAAERRGDWRAAVEIAKEVVRGNCDNEHWWIKLAGILVAQRRLDKAVQVLDEAYERKFNAVGLRVRSGDKAFAPLLVSPEYRNSELAKHLRADRLVLARRLEKARLQMEAAKQPAEAYVAKGACPFECCGYGKWQSTAVTTLYDKPFGTDVVATLGKGEAVTGVTGQVHLKPAPVLIRWDGSPLIPAGPGSVVFLLDYHGEGYGGVWANGKVTGTEASSVNTQCTFPQQSCWGEFLRPEDEKWRERAVWWVQIKTKSGVKGWTKETRHFIGLDRCA